MVVFAGNNEKTINCFDIIWPKFKSAPHSIDFGVFKLVPNATGVKWMATGIFGTNWQWQAEKR